MKIIYKICFSFFLLISFLIISCNNSENINKENEIKDTTIAKKEKKNPNINAKINVIIFSNDTIKSDTKLSGFGYDVYMYGALYIHQPNIPAINGNIGFKTKEQAQKAGKLVAFKVKNNIMPPNLTIQELDSLELLN